MSTTVQYGSDLILMIDVSSGNDGTEYVPVASATSHTLEYSRNVRDVSSKSAGDSVAKAYGKASWTASCDVLIAYDSNLCNYDVLMNYIITKREVKIIVAAIDDAADNTTPGTGITEVAVETAAIDGTYYYDGEAIIASVSHSSPDGDNAGFSVSFEGTGALTRTVVSNP